MIYTSKILPGHREFLFADQARRNCEESHLDTVAGETIIKV